MGTFSSEIAANRHNSGKFETFNALRNDLIWLLLHSWFSIFFFQGRTPLLYNRYTWKHYVPFLITPLLRAEDCVIMIQITVIYLLSVIAKFLNLCFFSGRSLFISWGGGLGNFLINPSFLRRPPSPPQQQQQTVCNADPPPTPNGPSPFLSQEIITLEIPNDFQNVIKHGINKKKMRQ